MHADLEFEYPHKLEKLAVKADVMKMIEEEEDKIKFLSQVVSEFFNSNYYLQDNRTKTPMTDEEILASGNFISYEKYYSEVEATNAAIEQPSRDGC